MVHTLSAFVFIKLITSRSRAQVGLAESLSWCTLTLLASHTTHMLWFSLLQPPGFKCDTACAALQLLTHMRPGFATCYTFFAHTSSSQCIWHTDATQLPHRCGVTTTVLILYARELPQVQPPWQLLGSLLIQHLPSQQQPHRLQPSKP
jgi:hypothetical protein